MKSRDLQPRLLYPAKISFRIAGHMKSFPDKKKLKEFIITLPVLYEMLKGLVKKKERRRRRRRNCVQWNGNKYLLIND